MATITDFNKLSKRERQNRYFSEDFKRKKVSEIDRNIASIAEIVREYQVSKGAIYKWIYKYSSMRKKGLRQVIEVCSDTRKILVLKEEKKELEQIIGQKQIKIDFLEKIIELAEAEYQVDIKKKFISKPSNGFGRTVKNTHTK